MSILDSIFDAFPNFSLTSGAEESYRKFRSRENSLVSCLDDSADTEIFSDVEMLACHYHDTPCGVISLAVGTNSQKTDQRNCYGRVDLVIVDPKYRNSGLGRVLVFAGVLWLLDRFGSSLYSISCLAAHEAIARIFESDLNAARSERDGANYIHESLSVDDESTLLLTESLKTQLTEAVKVSAYRLRQKGN